MADDWIKMRKNIRTHPRVIRIVSALCPQSCGQASDTLRVIGALWSVWCVFDDHADNGVLSGYSPEMMDAVVGWPGFSAAMIAAGWLDSAVVDGVQVLVAPDYFEHNGSTAKRRADDTKQKRARRSAAVVSEACPQNVRSASDRTRTREEKSINTPLPPAAVAAGGESSSESSTESDKVGSGSSAAGLDDGDAGRNGGDDGAEQPGRTGAVSLRTWLDACTEAGELPVPPGCAALRYAADVGLPDEVVALHWAEFKARHLEAGAKRYRDWRRTLLNSIRDNWFKLWRFDGVRPVLTSAGQQARVKRAAEQRNAPDEVTA